MQLYNCHFTTVALQLQFFSFISPLYSVSKKYFNSTIVHSALLGISCQVIFLSFHLFSLSLSLSLSATCSFIQQIHSIGRQLVHYLRYSLYMKCFNWRKIKCLSMFFSVTHIEKNVSATSNFYMLQNHFEQPSQLVWDSEKLNNLL